MSHSRPSARTLTGVLLALLLVPLAAVPQALAKNTPVAQTTLAANPDTTCGTTVTAPDGTSTFTAGNGPTKWGDDLHPPTTVRVLRSRGANAGHVETVNFWWYVGVVMRAEYSTGADKPPLWMQVGAITVKEYGWYKALHWGGGRVTFTTSVADPLDPTLITTTKSVECYDLKDTTADQIYRPPQLDANNVCIPSTGNCPTPAIYRAMAQTWHMSMRKWNATKNVSRLFLTGYRSGYGVACAADRTGYKIFQASLKDCTVKGLTLEETLRAYFEPVLLVDTRGNDSMCSLDGQGNCDTSWWGDAPVLSDGGSNTAWSFYPGKANGFASQVNGTFNVPFSSLVGYGVGNVDLPSASPSAGDPRMLADVLLVDNGAVRVARATGTGFAGLVTTNFSGGASKAVVGDFNGDLLTDVGLVRSNGDGTSSLWVMRAKGDDTFSAPAQVWTGAPDLTVPGTFVAAGDVNGDGKADLIVRDPSTGDFSTAISMPSCTAMATRGTCADGIADHSQLGALNLALADPGGLSAATLTVGDFDRDGRADIIAFNGGSNSQVFGMRARTDGSGGFLGKQSLWSSSSNWSGATPIAMNVDPDGMADLALVKASSASWLRTIERSSAPAQMVLSSDFPYLGSDQAAPSTPTGLKAAASSGLTVSVSWNPSTDNSGGTVFYRVYRDGRAIGTKQSGLSYVDHPSSGWHSYIVKAIDGVGNTSGASNKVTVKAVN